MNKALISFYDGTGTDDKGRTLDEILNWNSDELEKTHDYVQWLFPLAEPSRFNPSAPLLDDDTIAEFIDNSICMKNMQRSLERMMDFYELKRHRQDGSRRPPGRAVPNYNTPTDFYIKMRKPWWVEPNDHNFLRITRILRCLYLIGMHVHMDMFRDLLEEIFIEYHNMISIETFCFWCGACDYECTLDDDNPYSWIYSIYDGFQKRQIVINKKR